MPRATEPSNHRERKRAGKDTAEAKLLDDLDEAIVKRNKAEGDLGNLRGKLAEAQAAVNAKVVEVAQFEMRAQRLRKAFEVLHLHLETTDDLDEEQDDPAPISPSDFVPEEVVGEPALA